MRIVYLIHGTFIGAWSFKKHINQIKETFQADKIIILDWRRKFFKLSHWSRKKGAEKLASIVFGFNAKENIYICKSHGGNVGFLSCRYLIKKHWPSFIATIGMPIMGFYAKDYDKAKKKKVFWGAWVSKRDIIQKLASCFGKRVDSAADYVFYTNKSHTKLMDDKEVWKNIYEVYKKYGN